MEEIPDHELMARVRAGDEAAFAALVGRHQTPLLNFFRRLGASSDVEDLVQDVFVRVYRYRGRYEPTAKFTTFLYTVARHVWADRWRKSKRIERIEDRAKMESELARTDTAPGASERLDAELALGRLPEKLRTVLVLSLYQGLRYEEIGSVLGIPLGTVKSRVFVALRRLREIYHEKD